MKTIELTEEHKSKLLEMCKVLFPENGKWFKILCGNIYYSRSGKFPAKSIHWFEFVMTHLVKRISNFNKSNKISNSSEVEYFINGGVLEINLRHRMQNKYNVHPVDYLYDEFKKLK